MIDCLQKSNNINNSDFLTKIMQNRKKRNEIIKILKKKNKQKNTQMWQTRILCPAQIFLKNKGRIKNVLDEQKLR